jgi:DNA-binding transcriptional LysR family regulator
MELKNILTFLRVTEIGSFTGAAQVLGYAQSTVTIQIKQLEQELGVPLFDRVGKKVSLNQFGLRFLPYANEILRITTEASLMGNTPMTYQGSLRLGILESLFMWRFSDMIPRFHRSMPLINIEIKSATGTELVQMLRRNEVDIIYYLDKKISRKDCIKKYVNPERMVFVSGTDNPLADQSRIPLSEVIKQPLILAERIAIYRRELDEAAARQDLEFTPFLEMDNLNIVLKLLKKGMGVSFLPEYVVTEEVGNGEINILDVTDCDVELCSQVVYHKNKWVTPQMDFFMKLIGEIIE